MILCIATGMVAIVSLVFINQLRKKPQYPFLPNIEALADDEGGPDVYLYCRCHTSDNTCYGGNAISFRAFCGGGINTVPCSDYFNCP